MIKKRYDKGVTNDQAFHRIFSSPNASKYPTIGKFLPIKTSQQIVSSDSKIAKAVIKENDQNEDLDLLDQLVTQTLADQDDSLSTPVGGQVSSRAKETLNNQISADNEPLASEEKSPETSSETQEFSESLSNSEAAELSKELEEVSKETKEQREQAEIKKKQDEINNLAASSTVPVAVSDRPVVVLPITTKSKEEAKFKSTKYSVRWLLEWCEKIAKVFSGAVVYKEEIEDV